MSEFTILLFTTYGFNATINVTVVTLVKEVVN